MFYVCFFFRAFERGRDSYELRYVQYVCTVCICTVCMYVCMWDSSLKVKLGLDSSSCALYGRRKGGTAVGTCLAVERQVSSPGGQWAKRIKKWKQKKKEKRNSSFDRMMKVVDALSCLCKAIPKD